MVGDKERIEADPDLSHSTFLLGMPSLGVRYPVSGKPHYPNYPTHILHSIAKGQAPHLLCPEVLGGKLQQWQGRSQGLSRRKGRFNFWQACPFPDRDSYHMAYQRVWRAGGSHWTGTSHSQRRLRLCDLKKIT